jgi:hypothetical protein
MFRVDDFLYGGFNVVKRLYFDVSPAALSHMKSLIQLKYLAVVQHLEAIRWNKHKYGLMK